MCLKYTHWALLHVMMHLICSNTVVCKLPLFGIIQLPAGLLQMQLYVKWMLGLVVSKNLVFTLVRVRVQLSPLIDITVLGVVLANFNGSFCQIYHFGCIFNLFGVDTLLESTCSSLFIYTSREKFTELSLTKIRGVEEAMIVSSIL